MNSANKSIQQQELLLQAFNDADDIQQMLSTESLSQQLRQLETRYQIKSLLGQGALKTVHLAHDAIMNRDVALARLKAGGNLDDFLNEARLASRLEHPYISPVYDMGFDAGGEAFFVMKLYEGRCLHEVLKKRLKSNPVVDLSWSLSLFCKLCEAVSFAHAKGVLHLDIKPSNIRIDDFGELVLCDWGISRAINTNRHAPSAAAENTVPLLSRATLAGEIRGTPGFMAPEQIHQKHSCDERSDIYALGALLFDMLSGNPPDVHKSFNKLPIPSEIQAVCLKALNDDPGQRYSSVPAMIEDIQKYNQGLVTQAENAGSWQVLRKWLIRHRRVVIASALNLILIVSLTSIYIGSIQHSNQKLEQAVQDLSSERQTTQQDRLAQADTYYKQGLDAYKNAVSVNDFDDNDINQATELLIRAVELNPSHKAAWRSLGTLRVFHRQFDAAVDCFKKAGPKFKQYAEILEKYSSGSVKFNDVEGKLALVRAIDSLRDKRFRNHLIFQAIHKDFQQEDDLLKFSLGALAIVNAIEKINYTYDPHSKTLDLSGNTLHTLYPLKTLRFTRLSVQLSKNSEHSFNHLRYIPLSYLDISHSDIRHLGELANIELEELNLEACPLVDIKQLKQLPKLRLLNVYGIPGKLDILKDCPALEEIHCSKKQAEMLRALVGNKVRFVIKD